MTTAATSSGQGVFAATIMARVAYVALPIPSLVCVEVVERRLSSSGDWSNVTVMRIVAVVDVAIEAASAVKPRASADEQTAGEPIGAVVAIRSAVIRSIVEVPIGAHRRHSNVDGDLGWRHGNTAYEGNREGGESKDLTVGHNFSFVLLERRKEWRVVCGAHEFFRSLRFWPSWGVVVGRGVIQYPAALP
jgi:hypothetical protein